MTPQAQTKRNGGLAAADKTELASVICDYFCRGFSPSQIADLVRRHYGVEMSRETPYKFLHWAASRRWLCFHPPEEDHLSARLRSRFPCLQQACVVHSGIARDVAWHAADLLLRMLRAYCVPPAPRREVHIGLAGGYSMRVVAESLALGLRQAPAGLPAKIVLHALVAGFDIETPVTDPNAFFTYFVDQSIEVEVGFVALHAPAIVAPDQVPALLALPGIREAHRRVSEIDIIVTSAGSIDDEHSMLSKYYSEYSPDTLRSLREDGCVGDMLWLPVGRRGPLDCSRYPHRAMTTIELNRLPGMIRRGVHVLLVLGPCNICGQRRDKILDEVLSLDEPLVTHVVVDSMTARAVAGKGNGA